MPGIKLNVCFLLLTFNFIKSLPLENRLSLADEWNSYYHADINGPGSYTYGYDLEDPQNGNIQYRVEERYPNGTVTGSYGLLEPDGNVKVVRYTADEGGYRATVEDSSQKHPRHYPPLTSRGVTQFKVHKTLATPKKGTYFYQAGQSVQEIRTPPKYQNTWTNHILSAQEWQNIEHQRK